MGAKHTPGRNRNWTASTGNGGYGFYDGATVTDNRGLVVAVALGDAPELDALATARLIASAPDLLEALTALYASYKALADSGDAGNWRLEDTDEGQQTLAAIRKATGEAS
jgi:hypothetical protein